MKAENVKLGLKVKIESTDCLNKRYNGWEGVVIEIIPDDEGDLLGINILVRFGKKGFNIFSADDLVAI